MDTFVAKLIKALPIILIIILFLGAKVFALKISIASFIVISLFTSLITDWILAIFVLRGLNVNTEFQVNIPRKKKKRLISTHCLTRIRNTQLADILIKKIFFSLFLMLAILILLVFALESLI